MPEMRVCVLLLTPVHACVLTGQSEAPIRYIKGKRYRKGLIDTLRFTVSAISVTVCTLPRLCREAPCSRGLGRAHPVAPMRHVKQCQWGWGGVG